jgi:hypothetical protein
MVDVTIYAQSSNNGTTTPATPGSITDFADLTIVLIAAIGTNPTIATPTGLGGGSIVQVQKTQGATLSFAMYALFSGAGSINPSSVLGGTVTGWIAQIFTFGKTGINCGLQGSAQLVSAVAQLTNVFPIAGQTLPNAVYVYAVARATATISAQNTSVGPLSSWTASILPQAGVQGLSLDFYWLSTLAQGAAAQPAASGLLSSAVASVAIGAWFNTTAQQPGLAGEQVGGLSGQLVGSQYQGMIGG